MTRKQWCFYGLLALLMTGVISEKWIRAEWTLRHGKQYRCKVTGFDPPDFLRGRYIRFRMADFSVFLPKISGKNQPAWNNGSVAFVPLSVGKDGLAAYGKAQFQKPVLGDYLVLRKRGYSWPPPFDRFYISERRANAAERALREFNVGIVTFRVWKGFAVLEDLSINGVSVREIR